MLLMNVGVDCQCGYQARRLRGSPRAFFWDWLVLPDPERAVFRVIAEGASRLLDPSNIRVSASGSRVVDEHYGLKFQHDFPSDANGRVITGEIDRALPRVREKYQVLARRTLDCMRNDTVLFLRHARDHEPLSLADWRSRLQALLPDTRVLVAVASEEHPTSEQTEEGFLIALRPAEGGRWQGDDHSWTAGIEFCLDRIAHSARPHVERPAT